MKRIVHYGHPAACGAWSEDSTGPGREQITCKRCLASLAKRDREFRAKARGYFRRFDEPRLSCSRHGWPPVATWGSKADAARAIAREEGRL